ncbi:hypothetical protein [Desulfomonile tiedjei]|nr:hypothetical protein [Desulfomonile tiedjei]
MDFSRSGDGIKVYEFVTVEPRRDFTIVFNPDEEFSLPVFLPGSFLTFFGLLASAASSTSSKVKGYNEIISGLGPGRFLDLSAVLLM